MRLALCALLFALSGARPVSKIDRTRVVGEPVLDEKSAEGVYVWLEDGWFHVAAVARPKGKNRARKKKMKVRVRSTKKIVKPRGDFAIKRAAKSVSFSAPVGEVVVRSKFQTEGNITVEAGPRVYVGPLAQRAARTVTIGRF